MGPNDLLDDLHPFKVRKRDRYPTDLPYILIKGKTMKLNLNIADVTLLTGFGLDKLIITTDNNLHFTIDGDGREIAEILGLEIKTTIGKGKTIKFIEEKDVMDDVATFTKEFLSEPAPKVPLPNPHNGVYRYVRINRLSGERYHETISKEHMERQYPGMTMQHILSAWNSYDPNEWVYSLEG